MRLRNHKIFKLNRLRFWIGLLIFAVLIFSFYEIVDDVFYDPKEGDIESQIFDDWVIQFLSQFRNPRLNQVMMDLSALGSVSVITTFFIILFSVLLSFRDFKGLSYLSILLAGAGLWPSLLKLYFQRPRPNHLEHLVIVTDYSFPSGHAFGAAAVYIGLAYYTGRYTRNWTQEIFFYFLGMLLVSIVGVSRVYLGVHFPSDVMAGICLGVIWALIVSAIYELLFPAKTEKIRN